MTPVNDLIIVSIQRFEHQGVLSSGTTEIIKQFLDADESTQRELFENPNHKRKMKALLQGFFEIIQKVQSDKYLVFYCLVQLDGILEDDREKAVQFISLREDYKNPVDVIKILNQFIHQNEGGETLAHRDIASHILALLIEQENYADCKQTADEFLHYLMD